MANEEEYPDYSENSCPDYSQEPEYTPENEYLKGAIRFRRHFPINYPGKSGLRTIRHNWHIRSGNAYYRYSICRHCFDIRKYRTTKHIKAQQAVYSALCPSCGINAAESRKIWDAYYEILVNAPLLGKEHEKYVEYSFKHFDISCRFDESGGLSIGANIQEEVRDNRYIEPLHGKKADYIKRRMLPVAPRKSHSF